MAQTNCPFNLLYNTTDATRMSTQPQDLYAAYFQNFARKRIDSDQIAYDCLEYHKTYFFKLAQDAYACSLHQCFAHYKSQLRYWYKHCNLCENL